MSLKSPPPEAFRLIQDLSEEPKWLNNILDSKDPRLDTLESLSQVKEKGLIKFILFLLFDKNNEIAIRAGSIIEKQLGDFSLQEFIHLDHSIRSHNQYEHLFSSVWSIQPEDLTKLERFGDPIPFLGLCSMFPNGHVREKAIRELSFYKTEEALRFILLRVNDWVEPVRAVAKTAVLNQLHAKNVDSIINNLDLIALISKWNREDHSDLIDVIETFVAGAPHQKSLLQGIQHKNVKVRRYCIQIASHQKAVPFEKLFRLVSEDPDPMLRYLFVQGTRAEGKKEELQSICKRFSADAYMPIRRSVMEMAYKFQLEHFEEVLAVGLFDVHRSIREQARWYLKKSGMSESDFLSKYRQEIFNGGRRLGGVLGLGEIGECGDVKILKPILKHKRAKMRKAAFRAIANLNSEHLKHKALEILTSDTPSVSKEAGKYLEQNIQYYSNKSLWETFRESKKVHVMKALILVIDALPKWSKLPYLLRASSVEIDGVGKMASGRVEKWVKYFNRSFTEPSTEQISEIEEAMSAAKLNQDTKNTLDEIIKSYK